MQLPCVCFRIKVYSDTAVLDSHSHYGPCSFRQDRPQLRLLNSKRQKTTAKERRECSTDQVAAHINKTLHSLSCSQIVQLLPA
jgi:hypothetical protein